MNFAYYTPERPIEAPEGLEIDETEIAERIETLAEDTALAATKDRQVSRRILADALEEEEGDLTVLRALQDILDAMGQLHECPSSWTDRELINRFLQHAQHAILPLARVEAELHRERIEQDWAEECA